MSIDALILDFGEVLVQPQSPAVIERMARLVKLPAADFQRRYWLHREPYDSGLPAADYWRRVIDGLDIPSGGIEPLLSDLIGADYESWTVYRPEVWQIAADFKAAGGRTAILSNGVPEIMGRVRTERSLSELFDAIVVSYEVGCAKPDPKIYRICLDMLKVPAASALFVDDRVENLEAASRLGIQTLHFTGDASVAELRARIGLVTAAGPSDSRS
jgi:putative hydrolase of the HAD superfamily